MCALCLWCRLFCPSFQLQLNTYPRILHWNRKSPCAAWRGLPAYAVSRLNRMSMTLDGCLPLTGLEQEMELGFVSNLAVLGRAVTSWDGSMPVSFSLPRLLSPWYLWPLQVSRRQAVFPTEEGQLQRVAAGSSWQGGCMGCDFLITSVCEGRFVPRPAHLHLFFGFVSSYLYSNQHHCLSLSLKSGVSVIFTCTVRHPPQYIVFLDLPLTFFAR